jgi:hypothetical protein
VPKIKTDEIGDHNASYVVPEVEHIIGTDSPENVAARVGYPDRRTLARQLARWGRRDLANQFDRGSR